MADVKYDSGMENPNKGKTRDTLLESVRTKLQRELDNKEGMLFDEDGTEESVPEETEDKDIEESEEPKGLMARRV